ncbi:alginate lyase family protein, partial [Frankia sp. CiP1_Cm_nod1]|uniref:alginate lyase family protein n=1 Tax=Frankia sp. CiP1_Cm_nod1 TaxID=2897160 RepID=UPI002024C633
PYVASLRAWTLCGLFEPLARGGAAEAAVRADLGRHAAFLRPHLETDVGGNHLVKNLKALIGLAVAAGDTAGRRRWVERLRGEARRQVLADGGHYERAPAYHCQVLADLDDVVGLLAASGAAVPDDLPAAITRMRDWLRKIIGPDGTVPLLNDGYPVPADAVEHLLSGDLPGGHEPVSGGPAGPGCANPETTGPRTAGPGPAGLTGPSKAGEPAGPGTAGPGTAGPGPGRRRTARDSGDAWPDALPPDALPPPGVLPPDGISSAGAWTGSRLLADSGLAVLWAGGFHLVADVGPACPDTLPAHAHADTLAFLLWYDGVPLIVDTATSTYDPGAVRDHERSSAAHASLVVDGADSTEVWGAFRAGRRARPTIVRLALDGDTAVLTASHDGYRHLPGRPAHERTFTVRPERVTLTDRVTRTGRA